MKYTTFIGIDVSKLTFQASLLYLSSDRIEAERSFENGIQGFKLFKRWLVKHVGKSNLSQVVICLEHTGLYDLELSLFFQAQGLSYSHQNPLKLKRSMGISRGKSDRVDARRIARYIRKERDELILSRPAPRGLIQLHRLFTARELYVKHKRSLKLHKQAIGAIKGDRVVNQLGEQQVKIIGLYTQEIRKIEGEMRDLVKADPALKKAYDLLISIPGIGPINAYYFLITTKNFSAFDNWRQYAAYAGTAPFEHSSGTSVKGATRVNHFANKKAKALLANAANSTIQHCFEMKTFYEKKVKEGKEHFWIINAIKNKLISRVFAVIARGKKYQSVDQYQKYKQEKQLKEAA